MAVQAAIVSDVDHPSRLDAVWGVEFFGHRLVDGQSYQDAVDTLDLVLKAEAGVRWASEELMDRGIEPPMLEPDDQPLPAGKVVVADRPYLITFPGGASYPATSQDVRRLVDTFPVAAVTDDRLRVGAPAALEVEVTPATLGGGPAFIREESVSAAERQFKLLRASGWQIRAWGTHGGLLLVDGRDNHGDAFRGHIDRRGNLSAEPCDPGEEPAWLLREGV